MLCYDRESIKSDFSLADAGLIFYRGGDRVDENMESLSEMRFLELCYSIIPRLWKFSLTSWTFLHEKVGKRWRRRTGIYTYTYAAIADTGLASSGRGRGHKPPPSPYGCQCAPQLAIRTQNEVRRHKGGGNLNQETTAMKD